ncbi:MAG: hypothetical protein ACMUEM_06585 [Flavobacteriales bacterium AspAUS03]
MVEIENRKVLENLINQPALQTYDYGIIHHNLYDNQGIDCALIYQKSLFMLKYFQAHEIKIYDQKTGFRGYTRVSLIVEEQLDGEDISTSSSTTCLLL